MRQEPSGVPAIILHIPKYASESVIGVYSFSKKGDVGRQGIT